MSSLETDVIVVGAGPVGMFMVFQLGMLKIKSHIVDSLENLGGQCAALYPEKPIYDIPAHPKISGIGLIQHLQKQIEPFNPRYHLKQQVIKIKRDGEHINVETNIGKQLRAKALVIAAGSGAFGPNKPPLANIADFEEKSVCYLVNNRNKFIDKNIVIAGGGDSALDWAIDLAGIAKSVTLVHRRNKFRCAPDSHDKLLALVRAGKVDLAVPFQLSDISGSDGVLQHVEIVDLDGNKKILDADYLLPFFGLSMNLGPILNWGLNFKKNLIEVDPSSLQSNLNNIYAIGDVCTYPGKLKLILNGFGECSMAAHHIYNKIYPNKALHFEYSTSKGIVV